MTSAAPCGVLKSIAEREPAARTRRCCPRSSTRDLRRAEADAEAGPLAPPDPHDGAVRAVVLRPAAVPVAVASAARSRSSPRATSSRSPSPRRRSSASRPTCAWPACQRRQGARQGARPRAAQPHASRRSRSTASSRRSPRTRKAILRQKTLLGETYVELTPGNARQAGTVPDGGFLGRRARRPDGRARRDLPGLRPARRARRSGPGSRTSRRRSPAAARTSTTRSATCPPSPTTAPTC